MLRRAAADCFAVGMGLSVVDFSFGWLPLSSRARSTVSFSGIQRIRFHVDLRMWDGASCVLTDGGDSPPIASAPRTVDPGVIFSLRLTSANHSVAISKSP